MRKFQKIVGKALDKDWIMSGIGAIMIYELVRVIVAVDRIWQR